MKKLQYIFLVLISLFIYSDVSAKEYELEERKIKFEIPDYYYIITEDNYLEDEVYNVFLDYYNLNESYPKSAYEEYTRLYFDTYGMWLFGIDLENEKTLTVEMIEANLILSDLTYDQMLSWEDYIVDSFEKSFEVNIYDSNVVEINRMVFLEFKYQADSTKAIHYYLIHNGYGYNFIFESDKALESSECIEELKGIEISDYDYSASNISWNTFSNIISIVLALVIIIIVLIFLKLKKRKCPKCLIKLTKNTPYCPNCGLKLSRK